MSGQPYPKASQLARGERRYRRKVASPKQWQAIIAAKRAGGCRICGQATVEYHHLVPRHDHGDDVADNIVPLCYAHHQQVTYATPARLAQLAATLTDAEYGYVIGKLGEDGIARLFGVGRGA